MFKNLYKKLILSRHLWSYRNPYDRRCKKCCRHEVVHTCRVTGSNSWEVFHPGVVDHPCSKKDAWKVMKPWVEK